MTWNDVYLALSFDHRSAVMAMAHGLALAAERADEGRLWSLTQNGNNFCGICSELDYAGLAVPPAVVELVEGSAPPSPTMFKAW
jgi:hypothetical protein